MTRITNDHGSFEAPDDWTPLDGLGAARCPPSELAQPAGVRMSLVLGGDQMNAGQTVESYLSAQQVIMSQVLPSWRLVDARAADGAAPAVLRYAFEPPDEAWVMQYQAYWFVETRVSIVTMTTPASESGPAWEYFVRAVESFAPAAVNAAAE